MLEHLHSTAAVGAFALIINSDKIKRRAFEGEFGIFLPQQFHPGLRKKELRHVFRVRINFVIAVAAPDSQRRTQTLHFVDAIGNRIACAGDKIAGNQREIGTQIVGHMTPGALASAA